MSLQVINYLNMETYRSGHNGHDSKSCCFLQKLNIFYTERYRSGHNGADSKSVCEQSHAGSNPALSANKPLKTLRFQGFSLCLGGARFLRMVPLVP